MTTLILLFNPQTLSSKLHCKTSVDLFMLSLSLKRKIDQTIALLLLVLCNLKSDFGEDKSLTMNKIFKHVACRNSLYAKTIQRFPVPDELICWTTSYQEYEPTFYESPVIENKPWADLKIDDPSFKPKFNELDGNVNRVSHTGVYQIVKGLPLNPFGRTGIKGRGILGRYAVNHAADPVVSTWKRNEENEIVKDEKTQKPILKILCIKRGDTGEIALPGGMVDLGEQVSVTLKREFIEETLNGKIQEADIDAFFESGSEIYKGYVDDPRNTDNGKFSEKLGGSYKIIC